MSLGMCSCFAMGFMEATTTICMPLNSRLSLFEDFCSVVFVVCRFSIYAACDHFKSFVLYSVDVCFSEVSPGWASVLHH